MTTSAANLVERLSAGDDSMEALLTYLQEQRANFPVRSEEYQSLRYLEDHYRDLLRKHGQNGLSH